MGQHVPMVRTISPSHNSFFSPIFGYCSQHYPLSKQTSHLVEMVHLQNIFLTKNWYTCLYIFVSRPPTPPNTQYFVNSWLSTEGRIPPCASGLWSWCYSGYPHSQQELFTANLSCVFCNVYCLFHRVLLLLFLSCCHYLICWCVNFILPL